MTTPTKTDLLPDEIWKDVVGYEGRYQVSNCGRVKNVKRDCLLTLKLDHKGYHRVGLTTNRKTLNKLVHRLVLKAFVGESELPCNHINHIRTDNHLGNLEYVNTRENVCHAKKREACPTGVCPDPCGFRALIFIDRKQYYLGVYETMEAAKKAYDNVARFFGLENKYA